MAITRLKRKGRKNKLTSKRRIQKLALESAKPVIKNIDIEAVKAEFKATPAKVEKKESAPKVEAKVEAPAKEEKKTVKKKPAAKKEAAPKAEKKAPVKKAAPKKETKK